MIRPATLPIRTARLRLRDFLASDWPAVHAYSSDPDVVRFMFWGPRTEDESRGFVDRMLASQKEEPRTVWELAVERMTDGAVVGACDLTLEGDEGDLGFVLAKHAWGQGIATELGRALVSVGFEQMGLRRIFATCDHENLASRRVLEALMRACATSARSRVRWGERGRRDRHATALGPNEVVTESAILTGLRARTGQIGAAFP
jgi:RimJ/RimL family protein N-acetyltransferase